MLMMLQNIFGAIEQLWANKLRSLLTVLGIIIAVMSTIIVVAVVQGFSSYVGDFLQGMGTNAMWVFPERPPGHQIGNRVRAEMEQADIDDVERTCTAIGRIAPFFIRNVNLKYGGNDEFSAEMIGTTADFQHIRNFYVDRGRCFGPVEVENRSQVCVLGRDLLEKLQTDEGIVGSFISINRQRFQVVGLLERKGSVMGNSADDVVLIPHTTAIKMFPEGRKFLAFMVQAEAPEMVPEAKAQITNTLRRRHRLKESQPNDFNIFTQDEVLRGFNRISIVASSVLFGIVGVSLVVGGIGIMNVMLVSVTERTREIGLRKAVGARRRDILFQFLTEAVVLSSLGGAIGIVLGYGITYIASQHPSMVDVAVPYWAALLGVGFSVLTGVVFGLLPAFKAAILQPIDALRYE
jgi:putative ABC transport system permease protein